MPATHPETKAACRWFHALGDEKRLQIIECLLEGEQCVCDLTEVLGIRQSLLSFHLKTLKDAGLLRDRREGRWMYYALEGDALTELLAFVGRLAVPSRQAAKSGHCP